MRVVVLLQAPRSSPGDDNATELVGLSPCERAALALATQLAGDDDVVALTAGPQGDDVVFARARAHGATRCVRVADLAVDWDELDAVSALLARALELIGFDVVLAGDRSLNWASGRTGPVVAHRLGVPHLRRVVSVSPAPLAKLPSRPESGASDTDTDDEHADDEHADDEHADETRASGQMRHAIEHDTVDMDDDAGGFGDEEPTVADNPALRHDVDAEADTALSPTDTVADDGAGGLAHVDTGEQALDSGKTVASMSMPTLPPDTASLRQHTSAGPPLAVSVHHGSRLLRVTLPSPLVLTVVGCDAASASAAADSGDEVPVELLDLTGTERETATTLRAPTTLASAIADVRPALTRIERRAQIVSDVPELLAKLRTLGVLGSTS